jgi:hypothetical protein
MTELGVRRLLADVVERTVLAEHPGMSGAALERVVLADGRRLVVKRITPETDLTLGLTGAPVAWEHTLWRGGALDRLPTGVGHAIEDSWVEGDTTVVVMRDLGERVLGWENRLDHAQCRWMLDRLARLHRAFLGDPPAEVVPLRPLLELFAPSRMRPLADAGNRLAAASLRGWAYFPGLVPDDVAGPVLALLEDSTPLVEAFGRCTATLVHGDLATVNMSFEGDTLVLLDWAMPAAAPGALDVARFLVGCAQVLEPTREEFLQMYADAAGPAYDETAMRLALLSGLIWLGWNKTHDIVESRDPAHRERERADLDWWVAQARATLESGVL